MSIIQNTTSQNRTNSRINRLAGLAMVSSAIFAAAPRAAHGSANLLTTGDTSWFNTANWANGTVTGFLPESGGNNSGGVLILNANNTTLPATGVLFDPANQIGNAFYLAKIETGTANAGTFYIANSNTSSQEVAAPNTLTVLSGSLEEWAWTIGRDSSALLIQNGGKIISDSKFTIGGANSAAGINFVQGSGTYAYHGGTLIVKNQLQVAGADNANAATTTPEIGKWVIYNDGVDGAIQVSNAIKIASNSAGAGTIGIVEFHYDVNTNSIGNVRPVQNNVNTTNSQLDFSNGTNTLDELNLVLDAAPTAGQNLGLFKQNMISGSTFPRYFYATDGVTGYSQGATISAVFGGTTYAWTISYSGTIQFSNTANSAYSVTSATGGNDIVLVAIPEPASAALLGGVGSVILARRRQRKGDSSSTL
jgi:hypothetical protein